MEPDASKLAEMAEHLATRLLGVGPVSIRVTDNGSYWSGALAEVIIAEQGIGQQMRAHTAESAVLRLIAHYAAALADESERMARQS